MNRTRKWVTVAISCALLAAVGGWFWLRQPLAGPSSLDAPESARPANPPDERPMALTRQAPVFDGFHSAMRPPGEDVAAVQEAWQAYLRLHREAAAPIGLNEDLTAALTTRSAFAPAFLPKNHPAIVQGCLVDRWGTPFHLHTPGGARLVVRSAGPDRRLFTEDDLVIGEERDTSGAVRDLVHLP